MDYVGDALRDLAQQAEAAGVTLGLEDTISAADNVRIMDKAGSKALRWKASEPFPPSAEPLRGPNHVGFRWVAPRVGASSQTPDAGQTSRPVGIPDGISVPT